MTAELENKVALISGSTTGIGLGIAQCFVDEGAKVIITGHRLHDETKMFLADHADSAEFQPLEVTDETNWSKLTTDIVSKYGHLDILVNNAGVFPQPVPIDEETLEDWNHVMDINLTGTFLGIKHGMKAMRKGEGGSIINISSVEGIVAEPTAAAYNASKGGSRLLTKSAALDSAANNYGIRVNSVHPGFVKTDMIPDEVEQATSKLTPLGHIGKPEDIGNICVYLSSDKSKFVAGAEFVVDGGFSAR
ncbi:glucose 1-dehydrogenase [Secundilactobacillus paracollinoides]|uniref:glucose 1-dehydrogenase n=1 Tax=Secundilactobacillus paracollinoides TaxID=240427 RepID=UPI003F47A12A